MRSIKFRAHRLAKENAELRAEIERYTVALEWYADADNYLHDFNKRTAEWVSETERDSGERARQALKTEAPANDE